MIQNSAMLVDLNMSVWTANKIDKGKTEQVTTDASAVRDAAHRVEAADVGDVGRLARPRRDGAGPRRDHEPDAGGGRGRRDVRLEQAPEAPPETLLRRLSLDLVGLPPLPADVDAFVHDDRPEAYHDLVEKLLAMPQFGERMAISWLDLVRFADTIGYHSDNPRNVWPYRDYVIRALNADTPYDQFVTEHLAGDLMEKPRLSFPKRLLPSPGKFMRTATIPNMSSTRRKSNPGY